jgi:hypothetical protein
MVNHIGGFLLIDFGGCVEFGSTVQIATRFYCLDAPRDAVSSRFDLNCLAVTIKAADEPTTVYNNLITVNSNLVRKNFEKHLCRT